MKKKEINFSRVIFLLQSTLSITLGIFLILFLLNMGIGLYTTITSNEEFGSSAITISPPLFKANIIGLNSITNANNSEIKLKSISGDLYIRQNNKLLNLAQSILGPFIIYFSIISIIFLLRKILQSIYKGDIFIDENIKRLKLISIIIIAAPLVLYLITDLFLVYLPKEIVINKGELTIIPSASSIVLPYLLFGALIYIFAYAFEKGFEIKKENDLTV